MPSFGLFGLEPPHTLPLFVIYLRTLQCTLTPIHSNGSQKKTCWLIGQASQRLVSLHCDKHQFRSSQPIADHLGHATLCLCDRAVVRYIGRGFHLFLTPYHSYLNAADPRQRLLSCFVTWSLCLVSFRHSPISHLFLPLYLNPL